MRDLTAPTWLMSVSGTMQPSRPYSLRLLSNTVLHPLNVRHPHDAAPTWLMYVSRVMQPSQPYSRRLLSLSVGVMLRKTIQIVMGIQLV